MALKITQLQLKRKFREEIRELKYAIYAKCFDCCGFQADGCMDCEIKDCSLYPYRLKQSIGHCSRSLASSLSEVKRQIQRK